MSVLELIEVVVTTLVLELVEVVVTGTGAGSCRRRITGRKMTVVVEVTTRG